MSDVAHTTPIIILLPFIPYYGRLVGERLGKDRNLSTEKVYRRQYRAHHSIIKMKRTVFPVRLSFFFRGVLCATSNYVYINHRGNSFANRMFECEPCTCF